MNLQSTVKDVRKDEGHSSVKQSIILEAGENSVFCLRTPQYGCVIACKHAELEPMSQGLNILH